MQKLRNLTIMIFFLFFLFWNHAYATVYTVPGHYPNISAAIAGAPSGSTILVYDGVYGYIDASQANKNLYIKSFNGSERTIINGNGNAPLLKVQNATGGSERTIIFDGFTFRNGRTNDGLTSPVTIENSHVAFLNCIFENNSANEKGGAVLVTGSGTHAVFTDTVFRNNSSDRWGGAVLIGGGHPQATFKRCLFENNTTRTPNTHNLMSQGGALKFSQGGGRIIDSKFVNNSAAYAGGAIQVLNSFSDPVRDVVEISGSIFHGNFARPVQGRQPANPPPSEGGAVMAEDNVSLLIEGSRFTGNVANSGGGVMVYRGQLHIENSIFDANIADGANQLGFGGAIGINSNDAVSPQRPNSDVRLDSVLIRNNRAPVGGGIYGQGNVFMGLGNEHRGRLILNQVVLDANLSTTANNSFGHGGGIFLALMDVSATDSYLLNNTAEGFGGGWAMVQNTQIRWDNSYIIGNMATEYLGSGSPEPMFSNTVRAYNGGSGAATVNKLVAIPARSFDRQAYLTYLNLPYGSPTLQPAPGTLANLGGYAAGTVVSDITQSTTFTMSTQQGSISVRVPRAHRALAGRAFGGTAPDLPGVIEAERFDAGGHRVAYFDRTVMNEGRAFRPDERVGIMEAAGTDSGFAVGWTESGEWLDYTLYAPGGTYDASVRVAAQAGGSFYLSINGLPVTGVVSVPGTGGATTWTEIPLPAITLEEGFHLLRLVCVQGGFILDRFTLGGDRPWKTEIGIINPGDAPLAGILTGFAADGAPVWRREVNLDAFQRVELDLTQAAADAGPLLRALRLDIAQGQAVGYQKFYKSGQYRAGVEALAQPSRTDLFVPHIASNSQWETWIGLMNVTDTDKNLVFTFDNNQQVTRTLRARESDSFTVASMFGGVSQPGVGAARIANGDGLAGLLLFGENRVVGGVALSDATATNLVFPHVAHNQQWATGLVIYNPGSQRADVRLIYHDAQGNQLGTRETTIAPGQKMAGNPETLNFPAETEWLSVQTSQAVTGFEIFTTTDGSQMAGFSVVNIATEAGIFPKIDKNGGTGIAFVNAGSTQSRVELQARDDSGSVQAQATVNLEPGRKWVRQAADLFPGQDSSAATYITFTADSSVIGFQLNGSSDGTMLDAIPALGFETSIGTSALYFQQMPPE